MQEISSGQTRTRGQMDRRTDGRRGEGIKKKVGGVGDRDCRTTTDHGGDDDRARQGEGMNPWYKE